MEENVKKTWEMKDEFSVPCQKIFGNEHDVYYAKCCNVKKSFEFDDKKLTVHVATYQDCVFKNKTEYEIHKKNLDAVQRLNGCGDCKV